MWRISSRSAGIGPVQRYRTGRRCPRRCVTVRRDLLDRVAGRGRARGDRVRVLAGGARVGAGGDGAARVSVCCRSWSCSVCRAPCRCSGRCGRSCGSPISVSETVCGAGPVRAGPVRRDGTGVLRRSGPHGAAAQCGERGQAGASCRGQMRCGGGGAAGVPAGAPAAGGRPGRAAPPPTRSRPPRTAAATASRSRACPRLTSTDEVGDGGDDGQLGGPQPADVVVQPDITPPGRDGHAVHEHRDLGQVRADAAIAAAPRPRPHQSRPRVQCR